MPLIKPFPGLRPAPTRAAEVAAPPYDVVTAAEARAMVQGKPWSFLHVSRPEIDLPKETDPYAPEVYTKGAQNLAAMLAAKVLVQDDKPCFYLYRLSTDSHVQTGLVATTSLQAYEQGRIKKHELTRPLKEDDRVRQIEALGAQTGPVFLVHPHDPAVDALLAGVAETGAEIDLRAADGVRHELWVLRDETQISRLTGVFDAMPALYVADGHHRLAAASRVAAARRESNPGLPAEAPSNYLLSVLFPHKAVQILDYNRLIRDLNGLDREVYLQKISAHFSVETRDVPVKPSSRGEFGMYLPGQWYHLRLDPRRVPRDDPISSLEVSLLSNDLIAPILGISDQRRDDRIDFVGGSRGLDGLQQRVDSGEMAVAFSLFPTSVEELMAVADAGEVMPPKSTWFEPKLADGLVSHLI